MSLPDMNVIQLSGNALSTDAGASDAGTQRIVIATNQAAITVTANAGSNLNTSALALETSQIAPQGSISGGTAGTKSELAGAIYNTAAPTLTNGQQASLQLDVNGNLKTTATSTIAGTVAVTQSTSPWVENVSQFGGSNVATGTGASGAGIPRVTVANDSNVLATQSGSWTVTANAGSNLNTSALALDTTVSGLNVAQASTTSGEKGPLVQGAVTTAAPTYVTAQTNPLSLNTSGGLRTDTSSISGAATATGNGGVSTGVQRVAIASDNTAFSVNATPPTLTKGTQGATGYSTQDLKDAGRVSVTYSILAFLPSGSNSEAMLTLAKSAGTAAISTATSFVIPSGKRFRITSIVFGTRGNSTATVQFTTINFRINTAGAVTTATGPIIMMYRSYTPATANAQDRMVIPIPDGYEILGDGTLQFGVSEVSNFVTNAPTVDLDIIGFEY